MRNFIRYLRGGGSMCVCMGFVKIGPLMVPFYLDIWFEPDEGAT